MESLFFFFEKISLQGKSFLLKTSPHLNICKLIATIGEGNINGGQIQSKTKKISTLKDLEDLENLFFFLIWKRYMERYSDILRKENTRSG